MKSAGNSFPIRWFSNGFGLGVRHGARFEPAVEDFRDAPGDLAGVGLDFDVIYVWPVQIADFVGVHGPLLELFHAAYDRYFAVVGHPYRQRRAPETVAADSPVAGIFQPVAKATVPDVFWHPVDLVVVLDQRSLQLGRPSPARSQWRSTRAACRSASRTDRCA